MGEGRGVELTRLTTTHWFSVTETVFAVPADPLGGGWEGLVRCLEGVMREWVWLWWRMGLVMSRGGICGSREWSMNGCSGGWRVLEWP